MVDQQLNNRQNEFLWPLLANPADDVQGQLFNLKKLVNDYPQSGILQALLAHASDEKNLKQASVYFNPRSLFKLINDPSSLASVPDERLIVHTGIRSENFGKYSEDLFGNKVLPGEPGHGGNFHINENYFSDPWATVDSEEASGDMESPSTDNEGFTLFDEIPAVPSSPSVAAAESSIGNSDTHETYPGYELNGHELNNFTIPEEADIAEKNNPFEPTDENGQVILLENFTSETDFPLLEAGLSDNHVAEPVEFKQTSETELPAEEIHSFESTVSSNKLPSHEIEDEIFDEIVGIEYINTIVEPVKPAPVSPQDAYEEDLEEEKLIIENIGQTDFFVFDSAVEEHQLTSPLIDQAETISPEEEPAIEAPASGIQDQQDVSKYNDDKMPYTFMWWLDRTRKQHSNTYQPYLKAKEIKPDASPKSSPDELQQQYYENIFHLTSLEDIQKNIPHPPFAVNQNPKEQVIIERFIKEEPQIKPQSSDKLDNENKAKKSSEDKDELVTETLAIIYTDQMLYYKAIASYKKLMLKFPEKSVYFAEKIEQLEKKI